MVGGVPPCVPAPPPRTLAVLAALSTLTCSDLPELAVAAQWSDLARRRLCDVAVVEPVGCNHLVLQIQITRQLWVGQRHGATPLWAGPFTLMLTSCSTESKESQKISLSESLVKTKLSDTPESAAMKRHFDPTRSKKQNQELWVPGDSGTVSRSYR